MNSYPPSIPTTRHLERRAEAALYIVAVIALVAVGFSLFVWSAA